MRHAWGYSSQKQLREQNEDAFGVFRFGEMTVAIVCDGMGGQHGGEYAAKLAVKVVHDELSNLSAESDISTTLKESIQQANKVIYDTSRRSHELLGMGTTISAVVIHGDTAYLAHVGDSRIYRKREQEVKTITRDHTMVNLFVDAQLLSLEDAHSHPEAHVLSRSLGVERMVEVEVQEPMTIEEGDLLLLTTDGVHTVVADWELGTVDWSSAQGGIDGLMSQVDLREGADNATAIAILFDPNIDEPGTPTAPPEPPVSDLQREIRWKTKSKGLDAGPATPLSQPPRELTGDFATGPTAPSAPPETEPTPTPAPVTVPEDGDEKSPESEASEQVSPEKTEPENKGKTKLSPLLIVGILAGTGLLISLAIIAIISISVLPKNNGPIPNVAQTSPQLDADIIVEPPAVPKVENRDQETSRFFAPNLKPIIKDVHRPQQFKNIRSPGGLWQGEAIKASRAGNCTRSLLAIQRAVKDSPDYAVLYGQAWECFTKQDRKPIETASLKTPEEFSTIIKHFQGTETKSRTANFPHWAGTASGGIERRLFAYINSSTSNDVFAEYMLDKLGAANISAELGRDLLLEARVGAAFALNYDAPEAENGKQEGPTDIEKWWARRVFVTQKAMTSSLGSVIREQNPDLAKRIDSRLTASLLGSTPAEVIAAAKSDGSETTTEEPDNTVQLPEIISQAIILATPKPDEKPDTAPQE